MSTYDSIADLLIFYMLRLTKTYGVAQKTSAVCVIPMLFWGHAGSFY